LHRETTQKELIIEVAAFYLMKCDFTLGVMGIEYALRALMGFAAYTLRVLSMRVAYL
jgi:hypothetical protein